MYQLEERILFDGAAVAAVAVANQHHNDAAKNDAAKNDAAHHNQNQNQDQNQQAQQHNPHTQSNSDITRPNSDGVTQQHTGVDNLLAQALGLDHSAPVTHNTGAAEKHVNVMVISTSLDNADAVASLADSNTIVVKYDSHNTTSAQLLAQINDSLHGRKADSIAFLSEAGNGQLSLFKDGKTTVTSLNDSVQQQFWHGVEGMLDSHGRVDFLASNLASTDAGKALVSEIAHITGHETAASTDLTGNAAQGGDWNLEFTAGAKDARQVDLVQTYLNRNILDSFTSVIPADTMHHEVAFIDSSVMSTEEIVNAIKSMGENVDIVMLGKGDAFAQITQYLQTQSNIDAIHIISHGNDGLFSLGDTVVNSDFVQTHQAELAAWGKSLTANGDIMLYGCDIAADAGGKAFIQQFAHATGADVAASTDASGIKGNWTLEYATGDINAAVITVDSYHYSLTDQIVINNADAGAGSLRDAINLAANGDQVIFNIDITGGGNTTTITLASTLNINKNITIDGLNTNISAPNNITITGSNVTIANSGDVAAQTLSHMTINSDVAVSGNLGVTNFHSVTFGGNVAVSNARIGLVTTSFSGASTTINTNSIVTGNLNITAGQTTIDHSTITGNVTLSGSLATITSDTINGNLTVNDTTTTMTSDNISGNVAISGTAATITGNASTGITTMNNLTLHSGALYMTDVTVLGNFTSDGGTVVTSYYIDQASNVTYWGMLNNINGTNTGSSIFIDSLNNGATSAQIDAFYNNNYKNYGHFFASDGTDPVIDLSAPTYSLREVAIFAQTYANVTLNDTVATISNSTYGDLVITKSLLIENGSRSVSLDCSGNNRGFYIDNFQQAGLLFTLSNFTIQNGSAGGGSGAGIYNSGASMMLDRVTIKGGSAGGDGGGIYNSGAIQMINSTITGNTATGNGGGIYNTATGSIMAQYSTIDTNEATNGKGGGVYSKGGNMYFYASTIAANTSSGGVGSAMYLAPSGSGTNTVSLENLTIADNAVRTGTIGSAASGYAVLVEDSVNTKLTATNSIVSVNNNFTGSDHNISGTYTNVSTIVDATQAALQLGTLNDNGGWVRTISIGAGSTAIDSGLNNGPSLYDGRGYMRNGTRDRGSYEYNAIVAINQNTLIKYSSVQTAINNATNGQTIELVGSRIKVDTQLSISHDIILEGQGAGTTVLDANGNGRILYIDDGSATNKIYVRVSGISFTGGITDATHSGGAIWNKENLLLKDTSLYNNATLVSGGAIFNDGGFITLDRSELYSNTAAAGVGGAVYNLNGGMLIKDSTVRGNTALNGGGIYSSGSSAALTVSNSLFSYNTATAAASLGGAIYAEGKVEMDNSTLAYNTADSGSAIYMAGNGYWKYTNITVAYNTDVTGYAFQANSGNLFLINTLIINNTASHNYSPGGASENRYNSLISESPDNSIFVSPNLADYGGWTKTLAITNNSSVVGQGTNIGVPGYDQRGYGYNGTRDIGAFEYNGVIGILTYVDSAGKTQTDRIYSLNTAFTIVADTKYYGNLTVNLFNTRILESSIRADMWYTDPKDTTTPRHARDIYLNGAVEGGTVISAGHAGNLFTLYGNNNGATSPAAIMGKFYLSRVAVSDAVADNGPVVTGVNNPNNIGSFIADEVSFVNNTALNNGGALYIASWTNQLNYSVTNSLFSGNIAGNSGGAVATLKAIPITNSTIAYNRAFNVGGGIALLKDATSGGTANLNGVTVSFNEANNAGGGLFNSGGLTSALTIYAKNRTTESPNSGISGYDYYVVTGAVTGTLSDQSNNLVEYQNGTWSKVAPGTSFFKVDDAVKDNPQYHDLVGPQDNIFYTGYISDNGGFSGTVALDQFSAALDPQSSQSGTDQRGYDYYNYRDIGAFEFSGTYVTDVNTGKKYSSIQLALNNAGAGDTLTVKDVRITEHDIQISRNVTLNSTTDAGSTYVRGTNAVIDAESYGRVFYIGSPSTTVTMNNFYMTGGMTLIASTSGVQQAAGNGGAIYSAGTLTMLNASITDSFAQVTGGAIYSSKALALSSSNAVAFIPSTFDGNSAGLYGGAIYASGIFSVKGAPISSTSGGAGMYVFSYNTASSGGAIYLTGVSDVAGVDSISGASFQGNSASSDGGALYITGGNGVTVAYSYFTLNSAMNNGGMIFQTGSDLTIKDSRLSNAFAFGDGGGIYFNGGTSASMTIFGTTAGTAQYMDIVNNYTLNGNGAAIYMTTAADLNIYSQQLLYGVNISSNTAFNGSGGAIYFINSNNINIGSIAPTVNNVFLSLNYAGVSGGAIYMTGSADLNMYLNVYFSNNNAVQSGGALYMINSGNTTMNKNITFADNCAFNGSGGAMYFENDKDINITYLALANNFAGGYYTGAVKTYNTTTSTGGGIYVKNSGNVALTDVDAYDNLATFDGGALYIEDNIASNLTIMSSGFYRNFSGADASVSGHGGAGYGGGVCVTLAADVLLVNTTFGYNANTALWLNSVTGSTTVKYSTFAYNSDTGGFATPVSGIYVNGGNFAISDSIIYENEATSSPVVFNGVTVTGSSNNIFYRYDAFSATGLSSLTGSSITAYDLGGNPAGGGSANVLNGSNITGYDATTNTFIQNNLYLSTEMIYHANYLTRAMALESRDSLAYHYQLGGAEVRTGVNSDTTINYDQRGNMRSGITVNVDATTKAVTYVYYKYDNATSKWQQVTVDESGKSTATDYAGTVFTSIGAFEPNFYMTTTNNTDNSTNPDFVIHNAGSVWHDIDVALTDNATAGVTLREAIFWIDTYKLGSTNNTSSFFSQDGSRYVKFADSMTNGSVAGRNIINLSASAEYLTIRNDVLIGMIDNYTDGVNTYSFFEADNTFLAQNDSTHRITIDAHKQSRVLGLYSRGDLSRESNNWIYSPKVGLNNMTLTNGTDDGSGFRRDSSDGKGGGIYNEGTLTLNNSVVKTSTASNSNIDYGSHSHTYLAGDGGGIYTLNSGNGDGRTGYLYVIDSTITGNTANGLNSQGDIQNVALGGGIFQEDGLVQIIRSTISSNTANGYGMAITESFWNAAGGGIYLSDGTMDILSSTITGNQVTTGNTGTGTYVYAFGDAIYQGIYAYVIGGANPKGGVFGGGSSVLTMNGDTVAYNLVYKYSTNAEGRAVFLYGGSADLQNNIFANNYVVSIPDQIGRDIAAFTSQSTIVANNNNIIGSYESGGYDFSTGSGNIMGANETGVVTGLYLSNQLKYNGGMTQNYRLGANSVAINTGDAASIIAYDQRNLTRAPGEHSIGSYELLTSITTDSSVPDVALPTGDITFDYSYVNGAVHGRQGWEMNLRNALYLADQGAVVTINIIPGSDTFTLATGAGALQIFNDITVNAVGATMLTVDAANGSGAGIASRAFIIDNSNFEVPSVTSTNVALTNFHIANSAANDLTSYNGNGGAIYSKGHLTLNNVLIDGAVASGSGGAIYITGGNLTMTNVTIDGGAGATPAVRAIGGDGGAIFIDSGSVVSSSNVTISNTSASGSGGAIYVNNATQTFALTDSTITNTFALEGNGGAIFYTGMDMILTHVTINGGHAQTATTLGSGGAIYAVVSGTVTLTSNLLGGTLIENNSAANLGGGIFMNSGSLALNLVTVQNNTAASHGGGIFANNSAVTLTQSSILSNASGGSGGGLYAVGVQPVNVNESTIGNNSAAKYGGGAYINANFSSTNSTYSGNTAGGYGGGIYFTSRGGSINLTYVTIANNTSGTTSATEIEGGGVYVVAGNMTLIDTIIANNYSVNASTPDDFYAVGGTMNSATYCAVGAFFGYDFGLDVSNIVGDPSGVIQNLGLSSVLEYNGGPTMTLYLAQSSVAAAAGTDVPGITTSQNGKTRKSPSPSMGAYESRIDLYVYMGTGAVNVTSSWSLDGVVGGPAPSSFDLIDVSFVFNHTAAGDLTAVDGVWNVNSRAVVQITETGSLTIESGAAIHAITTSTHPNEKVNISILNTGLLDMANNDISQTALTALDVTSTVKYSYANDLNILTATYGNLIIAGGGTKTAAGALTVNGNLTFAVASNLTVTGGALIAAGDVTGSGNITADSAQIGTSGTSTINLDGSMVATNGDLAVNGNSITITGKPFGTHNGTSATGSVIISGSNVTLGTVADGNGNINAGGNVSVSGTSSVIIYSTGAADTVKAQTGDVTITGGTVNIGGNIAVDSAGKNIVISSANSDTSGTIVIGGNLTTNLGAGTTGGISIYTNGGITTNGIISAAGDVTIGVDSIAAPSYLADSIDIHNTVSAGGNIHIQTNAGKTVNASGSIASSGGTVNVTAGTFNFSNGSATGSSVTINAGLHLTDSSIGNADGSNTVIINGNVVSDGVSGINSSSLTLDSIIHTVTVNANSLLTVYTGSGDIVINDTGTGGIRAESLIVSVTGGILKFKTDGNITTDVNVPPTQLLGTLTLSSNTITTTNARFDNTDWLVIDNTQPIGLSSAIKAQNIALGNVLLASSSSIVATNSIVFNGYIDGTAANHYDLGIQAGSTISLNVVKNIGSLTATSTAGDIIIAGQVTANGDVTATSGAARNIKLSGGIDAKGIVTMNNAVLVSGSNASISGSALIFNGNINGAGNLTLSSKTAVDLAGHVLMDEGSALNLAAGSYTSSSLVGGSLTVGAGASLDFTNISLHGDLNVSGGLSGAGSLVLLSNAVARHADITLNGTYVFNDITLDNAAGASLLTGNATVLNNFAFNAGMFNIGNNVLQVLSHVTGVYGESNYFVAGSRGTLKLMVFNGAPTDFWIGSAAYASRISIDGVASDKVFGVSTYSNVTGQGNPNGETIIGINSAVHRSWVISGVGDYNAVFGWNVAEGPGVGPIATVSNYQGWRWVTIESSPVSSSGDMRMTSAIPLTTTGTFAVAAPGTNYDYTGSFKGLNDSNANSSGFSYPSIAVDVPPSQGEYSFDMMQLYLSESPLGNPLGVSIPDTGTDIGGDYANDFMTITTGESVYGTPNGEGGVNTQWTPEEEREPDPVGEELDRQLDDFFTELADSSMHDKHPAFKSEVEILLDKLLVS